MKQHRIARKIEYMHMLFGKKQGRTCKECMSFERLRAGKRIHPKCLRYGVTLSSASDWKASYEACGAIIEREEDNGTDT